MWDKLQLSKKPVKGTMYGSCKRNYCKACVLIAEQPQLTDGP